MPPGFNPDAAVVTIDMGPDYDKQFFFDLETKSVVSSNPVSLWDVAVSTESPRKLILNSARFMGAAKAGDRLDQQYNFDGITYVQDHESLLPDSLALKDWSAGATYLVDMGYNGPEHMGYYRAQFTDLGDAGIAIAYAASGEDEIITDTIVPDDDYSFVYYSMLSQQQEKVAPPKTEWDLLFTQYVHYFYEDFGTLPYSVNGALLNDYNVSVAVWTAAVFDSIDAEDIPILDFSDERDVIGYDWKYFTIEEGAYSIIDSLCYVIKDTDGRYHKMQFNSFFNNEGTKGYPTFVIQQIQ